MIDEILDESILSGEPIGFMSIDIDGNDFHVWKSMVKYSPEIVMIEHNHLIPNNIKYVQKADNSVRRGSSLSAIAILAESKGYKLVGVEGPDAFFVKNTYFPRFAIDDNSVSALRNEDYSTQIFQTYDGVLHLAGYKKLHWLGQPISDDDIQPLPKALRVFYAPGIQKAIHEYIAGEGTP